jgi:hypothetical protein
MSTQSVCAQIGFVFGRPGPPLMSRKRTKAEAEQSRWRMDVEELEREIPPSAFQEQGIYAVYSRAKGETFNKPSVNRFGTRTPGN